MWLHLAKVSKLGLRHHLNIEEWYLPTASCISPASVPDRFQIKCHCSYAGKTRKQLCHSMEGIRMKTNNEIDEIFHQKIEVSVPALSESSPWQQETEVFLVCLILLLAFFFFFFVVLKCICYCYAPKFVYRQRGNTPYIWSQEFIISRVEILAVCSKSHYQPRFSYYRKQQLFLGTKNFSANNKPVKIALPMFHPISWHYGPLPLLLGAPWSVLSLRGEAAAAGHQHLESFARRTIMFMVVVLSPRSTWVHFNMFANLFYTFPLPPLFCRSTSHLNLLCTADFKYARWYFSAAFVKPKTSFVQLQVCVSLTDRRRVLHCEVSSAKPVPHLFSPHASIPLLWRSQGLGHRTSPMFLYAALRC